MALEKRMSIAELFLRAIEKSYLQMEQSCDIPKPDQYSIDKKDKIMRIIYDGQIGGILKLIMKYHSDEMF